MRTIDLVGPKGYIHGWIFVGVPKPGDKVNIPGHGRGTVKSGNATHARVHLASGHVAEIRHDGDGSKPAKLVRSPSAPPVPKVDEPEWKAENRKQAAAAMAKGRETLFHGTSHQFKPGDIIDASHATKGVTALHEGRQYAFASSDPAEATFAGHGYGSGGHLYRVEPVGGYEFDPHQGSATSRRAAGGFRVVEEVNQVDGKRLFNFQAMTKTQKKAYISKGTLPADMAPRPKTQAHSSLTAAIELARAGSYRPPAVPRYKPTGTLRKATSASMRKLASDLETRHPDMGAHIHVRDAAAALDRNEPEAANRHLTAAVGNMTPQSLRRHGLLTDEHHDAAKRSMDAIHRHMLLVKDIQDMQAHNSVLPRNDQDEPVGPHEPEDDNLDEKPTALGSVAKTMNVQSKVPTGGPDPSVAEPKSVTKWEVTKQVAASNNGDLTTAIDLAHHFDPMQPRDRHGRWTNGGMGAGNVSAFPTVGAHDPTSMIGVGGGRRNWGQEASQMPDPMERRNHPDAARRARLVTPERVLQAQMDQTRMEGGQKPLHPELAEVWPWIYNPHGYTAKPGSVSVPKAPRVQKDPVSVTGLEPANVTRAKMAVRAMLNKSGRGLRYGSGVSTVLQSNRRPGIELSAQTARLAVTPAPRGKPGGPGLYNVKGNQHSPYLQNVVKALIRSGHTPDQAYAIAWSSLRKWSAKSRHPEVRAAASGGLAQEKVAEARAHAHSNARAVVHAIELVGTSAGAAKDSRTPLGTFGSGGGTKSSTNQAKSSTSPKKAALLKQAASYRTQADALIKQRDAMRKALASASGKTSSGQAGSKTSSNATTKSSAPATASPASSSSASSTASKPSSASKSPSSPAKPSMTAIKALNAQIVALQDKYRQAMAQARAL